MDMFNYGSAHTHTHTHGCKSSKLAAILALNVTGLETVILWQTMFKTEQIFEGFCVEMLV